ncbi:hypothetical protein Lesp02_01790 [Lentzea sp. NBRC 105346]|uniref:WXG100 family type VII secretion target n=1 Tax=Lentzea sp. NBRC 105346 TaxID=3032205 RepID=UPI0024A4257A|nr:WXG100 family type VII secretion target [Lentzea sp. NBRC 105346]GLZ27989.1 hypothetical protein Lesp02_01790 [Lentzea sp. NBRC 105346]
MSKYATGVAVLQQTAELIRDKKVEADNLQRQLNSIVDGMAGYWKGQAKEDFAKVNTRFDDLCKNVLEALEEIAAQISGTAVNYARQEETGKATFSRISARLG